MNLKIGMVKFRDDNRLFGIKPSDRLLHFYIIGKTGTGKSSLLLFMAMQDKSLTNGFCVIDPHGNLASKLHLDLADTPHTYLDLSDPNCAVGYNPLRHVKADRITLSVSGFMETLKSAWSDAWGVRMEHILRNTLFALMEVEGSNLSDITKMYGDETFRKSIVKSLKNETVKAFWEIEYPGYTPGYRQEGVASIQNKVGAFLSDPLLRRLLTQPEKDISLRRIMDSGHILLVNLAKGRIGNDSANILGGLLVSTFGQAALSRADMSEETRKPFFLYIDEFQNFTTLSIASMLSELRKYGLGLIMAHQYINQLRPEIRSAIFGNVGSILSFRIGGEDADIISRELFKALLPTDLLRLPNHHFYLKLLIDGQNSDPFSGVTVKEISGANINETDTQAY